MGGGGWLGWAYFLFERLMHGDVPLDGVAFLRLG